MTMILIGQAATLSAAFQSSSTSSPLCLSAFRRRANGSSASTVPSSTTLSASWMDDLNEMCGGDGSGIRKKEEDSRYEPKNEIKSIATEEEFLEFVHGDNSSSSSGGLRVIQVHATWCKACQKSKREVQRLANEFAAATADIQFGSIKYSADEDRKKLCHLLGVTKLPAIMICSNSYLIDGPFICQYNQVQSMLKPKLKSYLSKSFDELMFDAQMNAGNKLVLELQDHLHNTLGLDLATTTVVVEEPEHAVVSSTTTSPATSAWADYQRQQQQSQQQAAQQTPATKRRLFSWPFGRRDGNSNRRA